MKNRISLINRAEYVMDDDHLSKLVGRIVDVSDVKKPVNLSVILVDSEEMISLNSNYRKKKKDAMSLSFPLQSSEEFILSDKVNYLGDIFINPYKIEKECSDFGKCFKESLIHSFLHLISYDHKTDREEAKMRKMERKIQKELYDF